MTTTPMGDALVHASKLVNQYPHLPAPKHAITSERRAAYMLSLSFGYGFDAMRNVCVWAESFGAWVEFREHKQVYADLDLGGQKVEIWCSLMPPEAEALAQVIDLGLMTRAEPAWLMSTLDNNNQPEPERPATAREAQWARYWPTSKAWAVTR